jgi:hypothetical protein
LVTPKRSTGSVAHVITVNKTAVAANQATGRQRRERSLPSGKTRGRKVKANPNPSMPIHRDTQTMASTPGSDPGRTSSP